MSLEVEAASSLLDVSCKLCTCHELCLFPDHCVLELVLHVLAQDTQCLFVEDLPHSFSCDKILNSLSGLSESVLDDTSELECVDVKILIHFFIAIALLLLAALNNIGAVFVRP